MTDNELLLAISDLLDKKMKPIEERQKKMEIMMENDLLPRLQNIEACYTSTYRRYETGTEEIEAMKADIEIIKKVIKEHSDLLNKTA